MPLGAKPSCTSCKTNYSSMWKKGSENEVLCNSCFVKQNGANGGKEGNGHNNNSSTNNKGDGNGLGPVLRKSTRLKPSKNRFQPINKPVATKGKSRRIVFKKSQPVKAPASVSTVLTTSSVFYDAMYYQVGDVVSLVDHDGSVYYAQIRGFMQDQFSEKSAVLSWLIPTEASPRNRFDPSTYILGPEEDMPRKMEYLEFVCHAPSDYYKASNAPYPTISAKPDLCYIWTSVGSVIKPMPSFEQLYMPTQASGGKNDKEKNKDKEKDKDKEKVEVKQES